MSRMPWLRLYTEIIDDVKLRGCTAEQFRDWIHLLCLARMSDEPGEIEMTVDDAAWRLRRKPEELRESLEFFESRGMISCNEKTISVTKFMDRQYDKPSDRPAETRKRKRRQREREAMSRECHADVTPSHAIDTEGDRERDTDTEGEGTASASSMELSILHELKGIDKYPFDYEKDLDYIRKLMVEYPDVDILAETKKWAVYKLDKPLTRKSNPRSQLRNWMGNARRFAEERRDRGGRYREKSKFDELVIRDSDIQVP
jgi:hypothetical protein